MANGIWLLGFLSVGVMLLNQAIAVDIKIGALFDDNVDNAPQMLRFAIDSIKNQEPDRELNIQQVQVKVPYGNEFLASKRLCRFLREGVSAIFGPTAPTVSMHCMNICDAKEIPYIDFRWDSETRPPVINMQPHPDTMAQVFVEMIKAWRWKGFTILYETAPWLTRVAELLKLYNPKEYTITVRRINLGVGDNNYRSVLRRVKLSGELHIVIHSSIEALPEVLKQAQQVGLMTDQHQLIITTPDMHTIDLEPYQYSGTNITGVRLVDPENPILTQVTNFINEQLGEEVEGLQPTTMSTHTALVYDAVLLLSEAVKQLDAGRTEAETDAKTETDAEDETDTTQATSLQPRKLVCNDEDSWEHGTSVTNFMRNTVVQGLTGEIRFDNEGLRKQVVLNIVELTSSGLMTIGNWNSTNSALNITRTQTESRIVNEGSLTNKTFIVITALTSPYGMEKDSANHLEGNDRYEGFGIDLIHELSLLLGFNYTFTLQEDKVYGSRINGSNQWNGMIRELLDGRADLAITDLTITSERESAVDFTNPFMNLGISILFRVPTKESPSTFSFMSPFSSEVWYYLGGAYLGVSLCLFVLGRISPSEWDNPYPCIEEPTELENQFSLCNSLWFTIGALLQQGSEIAPKAPSTRFVAAIWWFFTLIMVSSYTANLAAFLTVESTKSPLVSAEQLKNCYQDEANCPVEFGAKIGGSTLNFFRDADSGTFKNMYLYMEKHPELLMTDNDSGVAKAEKNNKDKKNYAFLMESSSIEYIMERNCEVTQVGGLLDDKGYGIAMRKHSPYRSALSEGVLRLQETGRLTALKNKWWKEKKGGGACSGNKGGDEASELGMPNLYGVFIVLVIGSAVASGFGFIEWFFLMYQQSRKYKVPFREEFMAELKFVAMCHGNTKTVRHRKSESIESTRRSQSGDRSREHSHDTMPSDGQY